MRRLEQRVSPILATVPLSPSGWPGRTRLSVHASLLDRKVCRVKVLKRAYLRSEKRDQRGFRITFVNLTHLCRAGEA